MTQTVKKPSLDKMGALLFSLCDRLSIWSQITFGNDEARGPMGPLKHLEKEAREAQSAPDDIVEYADCLLLILDASRRAGIAPWKLVAAAHEKLTINEERDWPAEITDEPVEHIRDAD